MIKRALILCALLLLIQSGCQGDDETWRRIETTGILRIGLDPTYPPFEVDEGGGLRGLDVDLAEALATELGLTAAFTYLGYDGLYDGLATKQVDVLVSALVVQPERTRDFAYTQPYFNAGQMFLSADEKITGLEMMTGRSLAVELGAEGHVQAIEWSRRLAELQILPFNTPDDALAAAEQGTADAVLIDSISSGLYLRENGSELAYRGEPVTSEPYALVVRADDTLLLDKLDEALAALVNSGRLDQLIGAWLTVP